MIGDIKVKYCHICDEDNYHQQGCFKSKEINGELYHFDVSLSDSLKKVSAGFKDFVVGENNGVMKDDTPDEYVKTRKGDLILKNCLLRKLDL